MLCNQVESHPFFAQTELLAACRKLGIVMTAYSPLGSPGNPAQRGTSADGNTVLTDPTLKKIADAKGKSAAQVALAFQVARGVPTFPKSVNAERLAQNLQLGDVALGEAEMAEISRLDRGWAGRACWAGPLVERNGVLEPRDIAHPDYAWNTDGSERA
jgi:diketogulonate reductase-like aldo/keto reductase